MDDAGLKTECEIFLVSEASKSNSFLQRSPLAEFVELLEVVDTCCLEEMMPFCTAEIIVKWREVHSTEAVKGISARMLAAALTTLLGKPTEQEMLFCSNCNSPGLQLACPCSSL